MSFFLSAVRQRDAGKHQLAYGREVEPRLPTVQCSAGGLKLPGFRQHRPEG